jgi:hypothetical protein
MSLQPPTPYSSVVVILQYSAFLSRFGLPASGMSGDKLSVRCRVRTQSRSNKGDEVDRARSLRLQATSAGSAAGNLSPAFGDRSCQRRYTSRDGLSAAFSQVASHGSHLASAGDHRNPESQTDPRRIGSRGVGGAANRGSAGVVAASDQTTITIGGSENLAEELAIRASTRYKHRIGLLL